MAILRYVGADDTDPTTTQDNSTNALVETNLIPLENLAAVCPFYHSLILYDLHYYSLELQFKAVQTRFSIWLLEVYVFQFLH